MVKKTSATPVAAAADNNSHVPNKDDTLEYDLGNLAAFDYKPVEKSQISQNTEKFLKDLARDNTQLLFNKIFDLQTESADVGRVAFLPTPTTPIPRSKPLPAAKVETKWETFAKTKGIVKRKKSRMEFDEAKQEYAPTWGYKKANNAADEGVIEHKEGMDTSMDPWEALKAVKKAKVEKNKKQQQNNLQRATGDRLPGTIDLRSAVNAGQGGGPKGKKSEKKEKHHVDIALQMTQMSTASMGKFDKMRYSEPAIKRAPVKAVLHKNVSGEKTSALNVLDKVLGKRGRDDVDNVDVVATVKTAISGAKKKKKTDPREGSKVKKPTAARKKHLPPKRHA